MPFRTDMLEARAVVAEVYEEVGLVGLLDLVLDVTEEAVPWIRDRARDGDACAKAEVEIYNEVLDHLAAALDGAKGAYKKAPCR